MLFYNAIQLSVKCKKVATIMQMCCKKGLTRDVIPFVKMVDAAGTRMS